jgi:hypothetical protein
VAHDDHVVVTWHLGNTNYLAIEYTFNIFATFSCDVDAIVFDGYTFDGGVGLNAKTRRNKAGGNGPGQLVFILTKLCCQFDGGVVEFGFFFITFCITRAGR